MKLLFENWRQYLNEDEPNEDEYIGFHCQKYEHKGEYVGNIDKDYGDTWIPQVIQALNFDLQDELAQTLGRDKYDIPTEYDEDFEEWSGRVEDFLYEKGIHWIFVSEERPLTTFGEYCYKVYMPENEIMTVLPDYGVEGSASVYIYDSGIGKPILIPYEE